MVRRYVNNFDETFVYECTTGAGVITGARIKGEISQQQIDYFTSYYWYEIHLNMSWIQILKCVAGMESEHDNGKEDRRWSYKCCAAQVFF